MNKQPVHEILAALPPARRRAVLNAALPEIIKLMHSVFNAVGFPKEDGTWSPVVAQDLEAVRKIVIEPPVRNIL